MATPSPRWTRLEHDERREQILLCAQLLFSERPASSVSMTEIAKSAGVTRGLLNHYFGSKRDLEVAVVRRMLYVPDTPVPEDADGVELEVVFGDYIDRWLTMIERNKEIWFATLGGAGLGHDPEVTAILEESRERAAARICAPLAARHPELDEHLLQAVIRGFGGLGEAISAEWLIRERLTRAQVHTLLTQTLLSLVRDVAPQVGAAGTKPRKKTTS